MTSLVKRKTYTLKIKISPEEYKFLMQRSYVFQSSVDLPLEGAVLQLHHNSDVTITITIINNYLYSTKM